MFKINQQFYMFKRIVMNTKSKWSELKKKFDKNLRFGKKPAFQFILRLKTHNKSTVTCIFLLIIIFLFYFVNCFVHVVFAWLIYCKIYVCMFFYVCVINKYNTQSSIITVVKFTILFDNFPQNTNSNTNK